MDSCVFQTVFTWHWFLKDIKSSIHTFFQWISKECCSIVALYCILDNSKLSVSQICLPSFIIFSFWLETLSFISLFWSLMYVWELIAPGKFFQALALLMGRFRFFVSGKFSWIVILNIGSISFSFSLNLLKGLQFYGCYSSFLVF